MPEHRPDGALMTEELIINCGMEKPSNKQNITNIILVLIACLQECFCSYKAEL